MTIGQSIKKARKSRKLTQIELACEARISPQTISLWECDKMMPTLDLLICVANVLKIGLDELVGRNRNGERR